MTEADGDQAAARAFSPFGRDPRGLVITEADERVLRREPARLRVLAPLVEETGPDAATRRGPGRPTP